MPLSYVARGAPAIAVSAPSEGVCCDWLDTFENTSPHGETQTDGRMFTAIPIGRRWVAAEIVNGTHRRLTDRLHQGRDAAFLEAEIYAHRRGGKAVR